MSKSCVGMFGIATAVTALSVTWSPAAKAFVPECGNINLSGDAECELVVEGGCEGRCEPPRVELACAGDLYIECQAECDAEATVDCQGSCQADCEAECDVNPGEFSCEGRCEAECGAQCDAECEASENGGECRAACRATCGGECDASCEGTPPSAECEARCDASCEGQCSADANIDCQAGCQTEGFDECKVDFENRCELQCERPEGALFCDGEFVDSSDLEGCIAALEARLDIEVEGSADARCEGNRCEAEASGSASCATASHPGGPEPRSGLLVPLGMLLVGLVSRRARRHERDGIDPRGS